MSDFDIRVFSEEVFREFTIWKHLKVAQFPGEIMKQDAITMKSKLFAEVVSIVDLFGKKSLEKIKLERKFYENEDYAASIFLRPENKRVICEALEELKTNEIITEEKYVQRFTQAL